MARAGRGGGVVDRPHWLSGKRPIFQFVGIFVVLLGLFYALTFMDFMNKGFLPYYMELNARMSAVFLNVFNEGATATGDVVSSSRFSVTIRHGCDAIEPSALFIAAVLAFPARFWKKIPGLIVGTLVLAFINLVRIITLFYTGIHYPRFFEFMHEDFWQSFFVLLALMLWVIWAWWATRSAKAKSKPVVTG